MDIGQAETRRPHPADLEKSSELQTVYSGSQKRHPTPVLLPGKSHGRRSLVGCSPWGR